MKYRNYDLQMEATARDWELQEVAAQCLGITLDEYLNFIADRGINTVEYSLSDLEAEYREYCQEYEIPCLQLADYACYDRMGW